MVPLSFQREDNNISILKDAIIVNPWATRPISELHMVGTTYSSLTLGVTNGLQNWLDEEGSFRAPQPKQ